MLAQRRMASAPPLSPQSAAANRAFEACGSQCAACWNYLRHILIAKISSKSILFWKKRTSGKLSNTLRLLLTTK